MPNNVTPQESETVTLACDPEATPTPPQNSLSVVHCLESSPCGSKRSGYLGVALWLALALGTSTCVTNDAVSKFAAQSTQAISQGRPIFEDLEASCVRQYLAELPLPDSSSALFDLSATKNAAADPECALYQAQQPKLLAVLDVLTAYFNALSQLSSSGSASSGSKSPNASPAANKSDLPTQIFHAATNLGSFVGQVTAGSYKMRHLNRDIQARDPDVTIVISGLVDIVRNRYENHQLVSEENDVKQAYFEALGKSGDPAVRALVRNAWWEEVRLVNTKKAAADAYVKALEEIRDGHHALATRASEVSAKDLASLIQPYTGSLSKLIPLIQK